MAGFECAEKCDGAVGICRIIQAVVAGLLLFIGITCQFWAGLNVNDVPLASLCDTYSGSPAVLGTSDFNSLFNWYESTVPDCTPRRSCITFDGAASFFLQGKSSLEKEGRTDTLRYAEAHFYCKHTPIEVADQPAETNCLNKMDNGKDPQPCRLWPEQTTAPGENSNWFLAQSSDRRGAIFHVSCVDKASVYRSFLTALYGAASGRQNPWSETQINDAVRGFRANCIIDKGSDGYILIAGPLVAMLGAFFTTCTMFRGCARAPMPAIGQNILLVSVILLLVGLWSISFNLNDDWVSMYSFCRDNEAPLVNQGRWFDQTPCVDRDSLGGFQFNPYIAWLLLVNSTYIAGGVITVIATLLYLGLGSGFTETMMTDRMGKYLVTLSDLPTIRLPFPPRPPANRE
ncbi:hypothetical protein T484DRAFT_1943576 [Baffinella frigidus]|nr:hypothetical protein T484DRAFT_1943576 [Cryptophyta sp. CCMP2293]